MSLFGDDELTKFVLEDVLHGNFPNPTDRNWAMFFLAIESSHTKVKGFNKSVSWVMHHCKPKDKK
jgi:hypothetical protein